MKNFYLTFEFDKIVEKIYKYSNTEIGQNAILNLEIIRNKEKLKNELNILKEASSLIYRFGSFPITSSPNLEHFIDLAAKGGVLTPKDLDQIANDILLSISISKYFNKIHKGYPLLETILKSFVDLSLLRNDIKTIVLDNLEISDNASEKLFSIRRTLKKLNEELLKTSSTLINKYSNDLTDSTFTIRNGHYVLPFKTSLKNTINGVIHDVSDSGVTTFIEPIELIKINNDIYFNKSQEKEEIYRILRNLTKKVVDYKDDIINNNKIIGYLDFVNAKALYFKEIDGTVAELIENDEIIDLKEARHPLIDKDKVISNSFVLTKDKPIILISGPNAGGKTVVLKTIGLLVIMNQCGLPIPALEGSKLSYFNHVYVDIGDNQSLSENLSTFASHISNVAFITNRVSKGDLVLLDELGTGTSPKEGEAIALSVLKYLFKKKIFSLVTSHFDNVKAFALSHKYISNASMEFDELNYSPTYKFRLGVPGKSYGLLMAKRYKLNSEILETSKKYIDKIGSHELEDSISHLNNEIRRYEKLSKSLIDKENNIKIRESALKIKEEKIIKLEEDYTEKVDERIDLEIQKTLDEIDNILKEIKKGGVKEHQIINAKTKLKNINANSNTSIENNINIEVKLGDLVNIKSAGISGKVVQIRKNKVSILSNGFTYDAKIDDLSVIGEISSIPKPLKTNKIDLISESIPLEINVIGQRGDEALINVSKYLDSARLKNLKTVRIIHGSGKGILRKLIHEYLAKCDFVKNYHLGGYYDGQGGATIVEFK